MYAARFDDEQGVDTLVMLERVRKAINFDAKLKDQTTWLSQ